MVPAPSTGPKTRHLLFLVDHPASTGYAWDFITGIFSGVAERLRPAGVGTTVAYPTLDRVPAALDPALVRTVELGWQDRSDEPALRRFIRDEKVTDLYLFDRVAWDPAYRRLRSAGLRSIVLHDHTSGLRSRPGPVKKALKRVRQGWSGAVVDRVIAVSRFVARRHLEVECLPGERVVVVWNSVVPPPRTADASERAAMRNRFGIPPGAVVVGSASRAIREKGLHHLLEAFGSLPAETGDGPLHLVVIGDGDHHAELRRIARESPAEARIHLPGYLPDAASVVGAADLAVVPSLWAEAFGLAALEPLAWGIPVIASRCGGLPEVVRDGVDGILVDPGDEQALEDAMRRLLADPEARRAMGRAGRERAFRDFDRDRMLDSLAELVLTSGHAEPSDG